MIFDAGVFIALDNPAKRGVVLALVEKMRQEQIDPVTIDAVLAQVWRNPATQIPVSMLVKATSVHRFGDPKIIGMRCATAKTSDVVDASLAVLATQLDMTIVTTDPKDVAKLGASYAEL